MRHLGLHIGHTTSRAILANHSKDKGQLLEVHEFEVPEGMVQGDIVDFELLTEHFKEVKQHFGRVPVTLAIPSKTNVCTILRLPELEENEMKSSLEYELPKYIKKGIASDYIWDFISVNEVVVELERDKTKNISVLLIAFLKNYIIGVLDSAKKAGLNIANIEAEDIAIWRSKSALSYLNHLSIHFDENGVQVSTSNRGNLLYMRPKMGISPNQLIEGENINRTTMEELIEELKKTSDFYENRTKMTVSDIILTSTSPIEDNIVQNLSHETGKNIIPWKINNVLMIGNKMISSELGELDETYAIALGLALEVMFDDDLRTNILPKDYVMRSRMTQVVKIIAITGISLLIAIGSFVVYVEVLDGKKNKLREEQQNIQMQIDQSYSIRESISTLESEIADLRSTEVVYNTDYQYALEYGQFMSYLEKNIPKDVKIYNTEYVQSSNTFTLRMIADSQQSVGAFLLSIQEMTGIQDVTTSSIKEYKFGNIVYLATDVTIQLLPGGYIK